MAGWTLLLKIAGWLAAIGYYWYYIIVDIGWLLATADIAKVIGWHITHYWLLLPLPLR